MGRSFDKLRMRWCSLDAYSLQPFRNLIVRRERERASKPHPEARAERASKVRTERLTGHILRQAQDEVGGQDQGEVEVRPARNPLTASS
jgi:hypothetical protein